MKSSSSSVFHRADVEAQLFRILASREFVNAGRRSRFLQFIVSASLNGESDRLKESVIGVEVFDRPPAYDPKSEPIVRTEARRLREKLDSYYQTAGVADAIVITVPRGGYVPVFEFRETAAPVPAVPKGAPRFLRILAIAALVMAAAGVAIFRPRTPVAVPPPVPHRLTALLGIEENPSLSPDGARFAFDWNGEQGTRFDIYLADTSGSGQPIPFTSTDRNVHPRWSPDGKWIAWRKPGRIVIKSVQGGAERQVAESDSFALSWTPDSRSLIFPRFDRPGEPYALYSASINSGETRRLTHPPKGGAGDLSGEVSPDGRRLAFDRCTAEGCDVYVQSMAGGEARRITQDHGHIFGIAWTPDGKELVYCSRRRISAELWRINADGSGGPRLLLPSQDDLAGVSMAAGPGKPWRVTYERYRYDSNIWVAPAGTGAAERTPRRLIASTRADNSPRYSPDGSQIAFVSDRGGSSEVWVADAEGRNATALTSFGNYVVGSPRWSRDGRHLTFDAMNGERRAIFVVDATAGAPRRVTAWEDLGRPAWSADGHWIYFFRRSDSGYDIWRTPSDSNGSAKPERVTRIGGFEGSESADGKQFYFMAGDRKGTLYRQPVGGGDPEVVIAEGLRRGWWELLDKGVAFVDLMNAEDTVTPKPVYFYAFESGKTTQIGQISGSLNQSTPDITVSPDLKQIVFSRYDTANVEIEMIEWPRN